MEKHLYSAGDFTDRLMQNQPRILRSDSSKSADAVAAADQKGTDKQVDVAVRQLERDMDRLTDPELLDEAKVSQKGQHLLTDPTLSRT